MRYCYSLTEAQIPDLPNLATSPEIGFEIRLDTFDSMPWAEALRSATAAPLLATYRSEPHLGKAPIDTREALGWNRRMACLEAGFEYIDIELDEPDLNAKIGEVHARGGKVVLSHHDLEGCESLPLSLEKALATKADVIKLIGSGKSTEDILLQRSLYEKAGDRALVHFMMGEEFRATRVLCLVLGSPFTFLAPDAASAVAPGQLTLEQVQDIYQPLNVRLSDLKLFAVIGSPIGHSRSPAYHNEPLKALDKNALFVALPARDARDLDLLKKAWPELLGCAVTKPMKEVAHAHANTYLDPSSGDLGAVNTLLFGETVQATNTDLLAMMALLEKEGREARVRVLGYGGLGKAVVAACRTMEMPVEVCNRTPGRIPADVEEIAWEMRHQEGAQVIVQATSAGMAPKEDVTPLDSIPGGTTHVIETIYNPEITRFMEIGQEAGVRVTNGHALFDGQAEIQNGFFRDCLRP